MNIIKGKGEPRKERVHVDIRALTPAQKARMRVSRDNRQEYDNEKRARELSAKMPDGHRDAIAVAVAKMMRVPESHAKRWINNKNSKVVLDGKID